MYAYVRVNVKKNVGLDYNNCIYYLENNRDKKFN